MTWSLMLAGRPRAGPNSKPHDFKQKVQKTKGFPKTWVLTGKQVEDFRRKKNTFLAQTKQLREKHGPLMQQMKMEHLFVTSKNSTQHNLERKKSDRNCWNFARLELRSQVLTCSTST